MKTLRDQAIRLVADGTSPPSPRSSAPSTCCRSRERHNASLSIRRARRRTASESKGAVEADERRRSCAASCCIRTSRCENVKRKRSLGKIERHAAAACRRRRSCTSPGRWRAFVRGRHPDHGRRSTSSREGTNNKRFREILARSSTSRSTTACRSPTRSPTTRRSSRPTTSASSASAELTGRLDVGARAALRLHRARPRGQEQAQVGDHVPRGRAR